MKILAFAASNHSASINRDLVGYVASRLKQLRPEADVTFLDLNDYEMPIYSLDREAANGVPQLAQDFLDHITAADAVLVSFAEYNGQVTSAWKNIFDWMSRISPKVWQNTPGVITAAAPGPRAGGSVLAGQAALAPHHGMDLKGQYGVGSWSTAWDGTTLTKEADIAAIDAVLAQLLA